jgi:hypothetical protein
MRRAFRLALPAIALMACFAAVGCSTAPPPKAAPAAAPTPAPAAEPAAAPVPELKNTIRWATASEVNNFGYDVYRGDSENGPFSRVTPSPILGAGTSDETQRYEFVDRDIQPGRDYFYYVESISIHGEREKFTPVRKVPAKKAQ